MIGATILLREHLARRRQRREAVARAREETPVGRLLLRLERLVPRRFGLAATAVVLIGAAGFGIVRGNHVAELVQALDDTRNAFANAAGFRIASVTINGRKQLSQDEILAIGGVTGRSSLLFLDAAAVRDRLKANPWVADATVLKLYPDHLQIDVTERKAFAIWQDNGKLSVIADDGAVLEPYLPRRFATLPLVVGAGAETRAKDFLALVARYPDINSQLRAVIYVGQRRWNLRLKNGIDIRLPENDVSNALETLVRFDKDDRLLTRDITAVDLRLHDRLVVRLSEAAAKAREDQLKDKKPKKKAGEA